MNAPPTHDSVLTEADAQEGFRRLAAPDCRVVVRFIQGVAKRALYDMARADSLETLRRLQGRFALANEMLTRISATGGDAQDLFGLAPIDGRGLCSETAARETAVEM